MMKYHPTASQSYSYYFYETNLQGDIVAIYDANGAKVVSFTYDAWGNFTATVVNTTVCTNFFIEATLFRYRGYIYDYESNLYYLQSRYYDPETGRFINADGALYHNILGYNMYVYCYNNPVNNVDSIGENPEAVLGGWAASMWWLAGVDGPLPIGDILYVVGMVVLGVAALVTVSEYLDDIAEQNTVVYAKEKKEKKKKKKKESKKSGSETANDKPSWVNPGMIDKQESAQENATRMMNEKYGNGNWSKKSNNSHSPGKYSDYSKIVKWISRGGYLKGIISSFDDDVIDIFP